MEILLQTRYGRCFFTAEDIFDNFPDIFFERRRRKLHFAKSFLAPVGITYLALLSSKRGDY